MFGWLFINKENDDGAPTISDTKKAELCSDDNLNIISELAAYVKDKTLSQHQHDKATKILELIHAIQNPPPDYVYENIY